MSSPQPGPSIAPVEFSFSDLSNYESFMDSLVTFMNESSNTIQQVKHRAGITSACPAPVKMNIEEKQQKMNDIIMNLSQQYTVEASTLGSTSQSGRQSPRGMNEEYETAPSGDNSQCLPTCEDFRPGARSTPTYNAPPSNQTFISRACLPPGREQRAGTPRPNTSPVRKVASPDPYFIPVSQSSLIDKSGPRGIPTRHRHTPQLRGRGVPELREKVAPQLREGGTLQLRGRGGPKLRERNAPSSDMTYVSPPITGYPGNYSSGISSYYGSPAARSAQGPSSYTLNSSELDRGCDPECSGSISRNPPSSDMKYVSPPIPGYPHNYPSGTPSYYGSSAARSAQGPSNYTYSSSELDSGCAPECPGSIIETSGQQYSGQRSRYN